ncbi:SDR family NAD(P)-dependent oxidoreductase [Paenibacillus sp. 2TAB19]|uniref:SDR family NAD(P)-dependent oxidoreductase n=1 Tax=Paenibacillus sp. 2TAB19 TaxID=3233003 RepID=UPI003F9717A6
MYNYRLLEKLLFSSGVRLNRSRLTAALRKKTILITGASSGIGERLAYRLAELPVHLILVARREDKLLVMKQEMEKLSARVSIYGADLRDADEREGLLSFIHRLPDGLDIVVSNAGLSINRSIMDSLDRKHDFTRTMAINYVAPVELLLSLIPLLRRAQGHIINISTINTSIVPLPKWAAYQASKSAFDIWLRSASPELRVSGIATTSIYLPLVRTPMIEPTAAYRSVPAMSPDHVADIIAKSLYTRRRSWMPWWLPLGQLASVLFRATLERFAERRLRGRGR